MKRILILIAVAVLIPVLAAADGYFDKMRKKMDGITPKKERSLTTAVGGVRGAKNAAVENLYWKGEVKQLEVDAAEYAAFNEALSDAEQGDLTAAQEKFSAFLENYPESSLKGDVTVALEEIAALQQPVAVEESAAAPVEGEAAAEPEVEPGK